MIEGRRTKRRYAHELYPHAEEWQTRPLAVEVPYLYARAVGLEVFGTGWFTAEAEERAQRIEAVTAASVTALLADTLAQGLTGEEAWAWVAERSSAGDTLHEWTWERAVHYGIDTDRIKPYPCGETPQHHDHIDDRRFGTRIDVAEEDCLDCTEPIDGGAA